MIVCGVRKNWKKRKRNRKRRRKKKKENRKKKKKKKRCALEWIFLEGSVVNMALILEQFVKRIFEIVSIDL